jgi:hypothetical protein
VLEVIAHNGRHAPTSLEGLRALLRLGREPVYRSVARLLQGGLVEHERRGPFALSASGRNAFARGQSSQSSQSSRNRPEDCSTNRPTVPPPKGADGTNGESESECLTNRPDEDDGA